MSLNAVSDIRETEARGEELLKDARQKARDIVLQAESDAARHFDAVEKQARENVEKSLEQTRQKTQEEIQKLWAENANMCEELRNKAESRINDAVSFIMERIVDPNGDS